MKMGKSKKEKKHKKHKKEKKEKVEAKTKISSELQRHMTSEETDGGQRSLSGMAELLQKRLEAGMSDGPRVSASQQRREAEKREMERLYNERLINKPREHERPPSPSPSPAVCDAATLQVEERHVVDDDINEASANLMRAEMAGSTAKLARLRRNLENLRTAKERGMKIRIKRRAGGGGAASSAGLTRTSRLGMDARLPSSSSQVTSDSSVADMARREKRKSGRDMALEFTKMQMRMELDDHFAAGCDDGQSDTKKQKRSKGDGKTEATWGREAKERPLNTCCDFCLANRRKHLVVAVGEHCYLTVPAGRSLVEGHCLIVPLDHVPSGCHLDDDAWAEVLEFRKQVAKMVAKRHGALSELVVMETAMQLHRFQHAVFECVPVFDNDDIALLPAYFKKSFLEAGPRWASNKKVVELKKKNLKHAVPKGFPYISVSFELQCDVSMAHVIEDESLYSKHFAKEIVGGMMDIDATAWRNVRDEDLDAQMKKVVEFEEQWRDFDLWESH